MSIAGSLSANASLPLGHLRLLHGSWLNASEPSLTAYRSYRGQEQFSPGSFEHRQVEERIDFFPFRLPYSPVSPPANERARNTVRRSDADVTVMAFNRSILETCNAGGVNQSDVKLCELERQIQTGLLLPETFSASNAPELRIDGFTADGRDIQMVGAIRKATDLDSVSLRDGIPDCVVKDNKHMLASQYRAPLHDRHPLLPLHRLIEIQKQSDNVFRSTVFKFSSLTDQVGPFIRPVPSAMPSGSTDYRLKIWVLETDDVDKFGEPVMLLQYLLFTQSSIVDENAESTLYPTLSFGSLIRKDQRV